MLFWLAVVVWILIYWIKRLDVDQISDVHPLEREKNAVIFYVVFSETAPMLTVNP